jgi:hypothetical protein
VGTLLLTASLSTSLNAVKGLTAQPECPQPLLIVRSLFPEGFSAAQSSGTTLHPVISGGKRDNIRVTTMPVRPGKPVDEITLEETRQWKGWLLDRGINPVPIRQDISPTTSSFAFDPDLRATIEYMGGKRYFVGIVDGKIARLGPVESEQESVNADRPALFRTPRTEVPPV